MAVREVLSLAFAGVVGLGVQPTASRLSMPLTPDAIREATQLGVSGDAAPYLLEPGIGQGPGPNAAVYTPFVRVALAAKMARARDEEFDSSQLPRWITEDVVHVMIAWPCGRPRAPSPVWTSPSIRSSR